MSSERHGWFGSVWQHLPAAIVDFPLMTAGEQTKLSWARRIETLDDVPAHFRNTVAALVTETGTLPYLVLTPSYAAFIVHTTEKLVCGLDDEVRIYELKRRRGAPDGVLLCRCERRGGRLRAAQVVAHN